MQPSADAMFLNAPYLSISQVASISCAVIIGEFPVHSELMMNRILAYPPYVNFHHVDISALSQHGKP
jgi:hypothetical protein